jgi:hypothetical protein
MGLTRGRLSSTISSSSSSNMKGEQIAVRAPETIVREKLTPPCGFTPSLLAEQGFPVGGTPLPTQLTTTYATPPRN